MKRTNFTAWLLILAGIFLLLNHFDLVGTNRSFFAIIISIFISVVYINKTIGNTNLNGLFGAVFFSSFTLVLLCMEFKLIPINDLLGAGIVLLILGFSNLISFIFRGHPASNIIWAIIMFVIGIPFLIGFFDIAPLWMVEECYTTYWPIILIFAGLVILIDRMMRRKKIKPNNSFHQ